jgi:putative transposase
LNSTVPRRKQIRLKEYDYSRPGAYFVTICTQEKSNVFGDISGEEMRLNMVGHIAEQCWKEMPEHFGNIGLDQFVVMPNHVHGIIIIFDDPITDGKQTVGDGPVGATSRRPNTGAGRPRTYQKPTLGQMVAYFKYQSAKRINEIRGTPGTPFWQRGYYDHIIRDEQSLTRIRDYIVQNPWRWGKDKEDSDAIGFDKRDSALSRFEPN